MPVILVYALVNDASVAYAFSHVYRLMVNLSIVSDGFGDDDELSQFTMQELLVRPHNRPPKCTYEKQTGLAHVL